MQVSLRYEFLMNMVMKNKIFISALIATSLFIIDISSNTAAAQMQRNRPLQQDTSKYTCPMHPEIIKNQAGECPKCGMDLIKESEFKEKQKKDSLKMSPGHRKMMNDTTSVKNDGKIKSM